MGIAVDGLGLARRFVFRVKVDFDFVHVGFCAVAVISNQPLVVAHHNRDAAQIFERVVLREAPSHVFHAALAAHEDLVVLRVPVLGILNRVEVLACILLHVQVLARGCEGGCFLGGKVRKQQHHDVAGAQKPRHRLARLRYLIHIDSLVIHDFS